MESNVDNSAEDMWWQIKPPVTSISTTELAKLLSMTLWEVHHKASLVRQRDRRSGASVPELETNSPSIFHLCLLFFLHGVQINPHGGSSKMERVKAVEITERGTGEVK
jgi:hypothetical protein